MIKIFNVNERVSAFYSSDSLGLVYCVKNDTDKVFEAIKKRDTSDKNLQELINALSNDGFYDNKKVSTKRPIRTLYFCTSYNCNLECSYCLMCRSISCGRTKERLSDKNIIRAIKKFIDMSEPNTEREVVIYGGEPTLYPDMIKFIYKSVRKYEKESEAHLLPSRFILCTNGINIDSDIAKFIKESGIYPAVSFDGYPELHNKYRTSCSSSDTFSLSKTGYNTLRELGVDTGITIALGSHTVEELPEIIKYLNEIFSPRTVAANSMLDFDNNDNEWLPDTDLLLESLWKTFILCRDEGVYLVKSIMDNRVKPFVEREPRVWGCTGTGARLGVIPDGRIVPCMALSHKFVADVDSINKIDDICPEELMNASPYIRSECTDCEARATCGGGCPAVNILSGISDTSLDKGNCKISKAFLKRMIILLWETLDRDDLVMERGYYLPTYEDRRRLYGTIKVESKNIDYQYIPEKETSLNENYSN